MNINDSDVNTSFYELVGCLGTADGTDIIECAGNTENQEGEDTEFNGEVFPHEVTVTQYRSEPKR